MKTALRSAIPHGDLYERLTSIGWSLKKIDMKNGLYVASGVGPAEQEIERVGQSPELALAALLNFAVRSNGVRRMAALNKFAAWSTSWVDQKDEIALAYSKLPAFDQKAIPAWRALAAESKVQADAIRQQIKVEVTDEPEPYPTAQEMCKDVHQNKRFVVSRANIEHPIWTVEDCVNFRIVHDVLGHCQSGGDFSWLGENLACGVHFPLVSPLAREALFTECIGQTAYRSFYRGFGPQKVGLMSDFLHPAQEREGEHVFVPHAGIPALQQAPNENAKGTNDQGNEDANTQGEGQWQQSFNPTMLGIHGDGSSPVMRPMFQSKTAKLVSDNLPFDPNKHYKPVTKGQPVTNGDPNDYIDTAATLDNAAKIDTEWWEKDEATQRRAIMNAFRVAILSPRKHLKWNAAHYQALQHVDPATSAMDMWHILESEREKHNQGLGHPEGSHLRYRQNLAYMADQIAQQSGETEQQAMAQAKEVVFKKIKEFEAELGRQPELGETSELRRYNMARKMVEQWMQQHFSPSPGWMPGQMALAKFANGEPVAPEHLVGLHITVLGNGDPQFAVPATVTRVDDHFIYFRNDGSQHEGGVDRKRFNLWWKKGWVKLDSSPDTMPDAWTAGFEPVVLPGGGEGRPFERGEYVTGAPGSGREGMRGYIEGHDEDGTHLVQWYPLDSDVEHRSLSDLRPHGRHLATDEWGADPTLFDLPAQTQTTDFTGFANHDAKYGAFMGTHLDALAQVGQHIGAIHNAALEDIENDGGKGHTFRNKVMNMNLPGVNPKVCSFAWLLLRPMSSDLGIIDTHILRGLRRAERDMSVKDYYKFERMQKALKDASGYGHIPLGLYHWGLWDHIRNPGHHSDHSALRVLDPKPWDDADSVWDAASSMRDGIFTGHPALESVRPIAEQTGFDFDNDFAGQRREMVPMVGRGTDAESQRRVSPFVVPFPRSL